jgi:hypothetical protein
VEIETLNREPPRHDVDKRRGYCRVKRSHRDRLPDRRPAREHANRQRSLHPSARKRLLRGRRRCRVLATVRRHHKERLSGIGSCMSPPERVPR